MLMVLAGIGAFIFLIPCLGLLLYALYGIPFLVKEMIKQKTFDIDIGDDSASKKMIAASTLIAVTGLFYLIWSASYVLHNLLQHYF